MINDHSIQRLSEIPKTKIQQQSLFWEIVNLLVMLTINMLDGQRGDNLQQVLYVLTPVTQIRGV